MITRQTVSEKLLEYLNQGITLAELVEWAENCFVIGGFEPDEDIVLLRDILMALAAADTTAFPLTWEACMNYMKLLGSPVKVIVAGV